MTIATIGGRPLYFSTPYFQTLQFGSTAVKPHTSGQNRKIHTPATYRKDIHKQMHTASIQSHQTPYLAATVFLLISENIRQHQKDLEDGTLSGRQWKIALTSAEAELQERWPHALIALTTNETARLYREENMRMDPHIKETVRARILQSPKAKELIIEPFKRPVEDAIQAFDQLQRKHFKATDAPNKLKEQEDVLVTLARAYDQVWLANEEAKEFPSGRQSSLWQDAYVELLAKGESRFREGISGLNPHSLQRIRRQMDGQQDNPLYDMLVKAITQPPAGGKAAMIFR